MDYKTYREKYGDRYKNRYKRLVIHLGTDGHIEDDLKEIYNEFNSKYPEVRGGFASFLKILLQIGMDNLWRTYER